MKGFILMNAYPNGDKFYRQSERIKLALNNKGVECDIILNGEKLVDINSKGDISSFKEYDFGVYLDKDRYLHKLLEKSKIKLFNCAKAIDVCDDKILTYIELLGKGINIVETIPAPLCYTPNAIVNKKFLNNVAEKLKFPLVIKKCYGSFGKGVVLVHNMEELEEISQEFIYTPHLFQKYIKESSGRDIRVIVIGGKAIAAMERIAVKGEFRSNIELGGEGKKITPSKEVIDTAEKAAQILNLDYCGVDILEGKDGPIVCEVNSNAFFEGIESVTNIDIAEKYAEHIVKEINKMQTN